VKYEYNPWPLGDLPLDLQRTEPATLKQLGISWEDPRDIVDIFELKLAEYVGSKYAVTTDSCSNALFLALVLRDVQEEVIIPAQTYASVPIQIHHAGGIPVFKDIEWSGQYELGNTGIWDSAGRFTEGMFLGGGFIQCLSFQIKKRLPIGRGGAILTNSKDEYRKLKLMSYDGRDLTLPYTDPEHIKSIGWHHYMTPEDAARGIILMDKIPKLSKDTMSHNSYPDLRNWKFLTSLSSKKKEA
jgi:dTDP-4-amino-4,6-dideoxygalactose transaminase